jgi:hypothetical protein
MLFCDGGKEWPRRTARTNGVRFGEARQLGSAAWFALPREVLLALG